MLRDEGLYKRCFDGVFAQYGGFNEHTDTELVDGPWSSLRDVENLIDGIVGEDVGFGFCAFQMELDVASGVVESERLESVSKGETGTEWLEDAELEDLEQTFDTANEDAETIFGVEVICGEASEYIGDIGIEPLCVVENENGVSTSLLLVIDQEFLCGVEKVDGVILHG